MTVRWTDDMDGQLRALFEQGRSYGEIGDVIGVNRNQVAGRCCRLKLLRDPAAAAEREEKRKDKRDLDMLSDVRDGHSIRDTAKHWGVPYSYLQTLVLAAKEAA